MKYYKHRSISIRPLVLGYLERIASRAFEDFPRQVTELIGNQHGVYALYKGDHLYYVGLATNLRGRIRQHLNDRHAGKWDRFSLYLVRKADHIKELESLILRIADPKGNTTKGKLRQAENLQKVLHDKIRQEQNSQIRILMGVKARIPKSRREYNHRQQPSLAPYIHGPMIISAKYKGKTYKATIRRDGRIRFNRTVYNSPSFAGSVVRGGKQTDGWCFWRFRDSKGNWVLLNELRK